MKRRSVIQGLAIASVGAPLMGVNKMQLEPLVETRSGKLRGAVVDGVYAFKGIRYARAERFLPPRPPTAWSGVQDALAYGSIAPQTNPNPPPGLPYVITAQFPRPANAPPPAETVESEDCLFLNVWTSSLDRARKVPVMVWLHGGFFYGGSGATGDGTALARRGDVVMVSLNHRLNVFGFTQLTDIAGPEFAHSGNAGMLDIIAALEWVRDNIEAFGGDPGRVMVFGASGGGMKTSFLMGSPRAHGLFHRAGVQSGPGLSFMTPDQAAHATELLLGNLGLRPNDARKLQTMPSQQLLAAYHAVAAKLPPKRFIDLPSFSPVLDPDLLPRHPFSPDASPLARAIPMLIGWNAQEMSFFMGNDPAAFTLDEAGLRERLATFLGHRADAAYRLYLRQYPGTSASRRFIQAYSDYSLMVPTLAQADRKDAAGGAPVFAYRFDRQSPALGGKLGALHTSEAPYVFNAVEKSVAMTGDTPQARALAGVMSSAWVHFATTGNPNGSVMPYWPRYTARGGEVMLFSDRPQVAIHPQAEERALMRPLLDA